MRRPRVGHGLVAVWLVMSVSSLTACGRQDGSADDARRGAAGAVQLPRGLSAGAQPDRPAAEQDGADQEDADITRGLFEGIVALVAGTSECVELAAAARRRAAAAPQVVSADSARIALVPGLRVVYAVAKEDRDYESWVEVTATDETGLNLRLHSGMDDSNAVRRVLWQDLEDARCFAANYTGEPSVGGPGLTWLSLSRALLAELRADGEVEFGLANESVPRTRRFATFVGPLRRVGTGTFTLMLDDSLIDVPSIAAHAELRHGDAEKQEDFEFMDDPSLPLMLRACCLRSSDHVVRIERRRERRIERALAETGRATVYGIQFDFGSAELREDSEPVIEEIADALRAHPDWRLRVEGHTDAIGDAAANLELSRRRTAAVREELLRRLGPAVADRLDAVGFGEARPRADNETLEGRAANRRVELVRAYP